MGNCCQYLLKWIRTARVYNIAGHTLRQLSQIAQGGYGYVLLVQDCHTRKKFALKKLICQTQQQKKNYHHEVDIMKRLAHCPHVISFHGNHQISRDGFLQAYILMQLASKTVYDLLAEADKSGRSISQQEILKVFREICLGLQQMHKLGIFHRDLKVENVLLCEDGGAKLCDLGSSSDQTIDLASIPKAKMYHYQQRFQQHTTLMYRPPEMIDLYLKYPVDDRVDIWMLGCVLFVLVYRYHPFQQQGKLSIVNANVRYPPQKTNAKIQDLIRHLLTPNPHFRPRIEEVLQIVEGWESLLEIPLNKVARTIKQDQEYVLNGQYELTSKGNWRNIQLDQ